MENKWVKAFRKITVISALLLIITMMAGCTSTKIGNNKPGGTAQSSENATTGTIESTVGPGNDGSAYETTDGTIDGSAENAPSDNGTAVDNTAATDPVIDYNVVKPNESGKIMVVMFHNFVSEYKKGDKQYTTTFNAFEQLLPKLYEKGYRLVNLNDMLANNIDVPAGTIPMVFTFDDGTSGQFNLVETDTAATVADENSANKPALEVNKLSAVGIMEEFNKEHPDFGIKGTFFVNLGCQTFRGSGTLAERLQYLVDSGFEIGNHTYTHINLKKTKDALTIQEELGKNVKTMQELVPGYILKTFSLPYGLPSEELQQYVMKGDFEGIQYENTGILEVGWDPSPSPVSLKFNPMSIHRVRANGIENVEADLDWWLEELSREEQYVSDGDPETVVIPEKRKDLIDASHLNGKKLVTY